MTQPFLDPEAAGRAAAEALVADIEKLKAALGGPEATADRAVASGEVAVAAMKQLLGDMTRRMQLPEDG